MDFLEELSTDGRIITIKPIFKKQDEVVDWTDVAQNRERYWAFVNTAMSPRIP
jgi:hypothetical protein